MKNKICVYAICKNESQFVEQWVESMSEADYIVVLDTGSTDNTYELLKENPKIHRVEQKVINPWRFDVARNESLKLVPEDANILLCTDLDEWLEPGWGDIIRNSWVEGEHVRGIYKYAWSHDESGNPARIFYYDKLHARGWYWAAPVHEYLQNDNVDAEYERVHTLNLFDSGVYLHHFPDNTKSRGSYLPLLELRAKENPDDHNGIYYLSHEYYYRGKYEKSIEVLNHILTNKKWDNIRTPLEEAACYLFMGDDYLGLGDQYKALYYYNLAISKDPTYREPYLLAAQIYNDLKMYYIAIGYIEECKRNTYRHYNWLERETSWKEAIDDILSVSYFYIGKIDKSLAHAKRAFFYNSSSERLKSNYELIENAVINDINRR